MMGMVSSKIFNGCGNIDLYVPYGTNIREHVGPNVTVHESEPTAADLKAEKIEKKATIIGIDVNAHEIARTPSEVLGVLTSITEPDWKDIVNRILLDARNGIRARVVRGVDGLMFKSESLIDWYSEIKKVQVSNDFALLWDKRSIKVVYINREVCKKALEITILQYQRYSSRYASRDGYTYKLPTQHVNNSSTNPVKSIEILSPESFKIIRKYGTDVEEIYIQ